MRALALFALLVALAAASTKKKTNKCNCVLRVKVEGGLIWDRSDCCSEWVVRNTSVPRLTVSGRVYRLVNGSRYEPYSQTEGVRMVVYPGLDIVMYAADNEYTNWTCAEWWCRAVMVFRNASSYAGCNVVYENGDCVVDDVPADQFAPLCHNSTASPCVVWVPLAPITGGPWMTAITLTIAALAILVVVQLCASTDVCVTFGLWIWLFILSEITVVVVMRFEEWIVGLQVDLGYVTYQSCIRQCGDHAEMYESLAATNQCDDLAVSCTGAPSEGRWQMCRSCRSASDEWMNMVEYAMLAKMSVMVSWVALTAYVLVPRKTVPVFCALYMPMLAMAVAWPVMLCRVRVDLMALYSSPFDNEKALVEIGWAWFALSLVWCFMCGLGKVLWAANKTHECRPRAELVFVSQ